MLLTQLLLLISCSQEEILPEIYTNKYVDKSEIISRATDLSFESKKVSITDINTLLRSNKLQTPKSISKSETSYSVISLNYHNKTIAYAINYSTGGYIIISGSKTLDPILAYSPTGTFNQTEECESFNSWLNEYSEEIAKREAMPEDSIRATLNRWNVLLGKKQQSILKSSPDAETLNDPMYQECIQRYCEALNEVGKTGYQELYFGGERFSDDSELCDRIWEYAKQNVCYAYEDYWDQLCFVIIRDNIENELMPNTLNTAWGPQDGFNLNFPIDNEGKRQPVSCAPLAMGQLMYFHKHPEQYNWELMDPTFACPNNTQLLWDIAKEAGTTSEGTSNSNYIPTFNAFGYKTTEVVNPNLDKIYLEMKRNSYPVLASGKDVNNSNYRHAWLLTGYHFQHNEKNMILYYVNSPYSAAQWTDFAKEVNTHKLMFWMKWGNYGIEDGFYSIPSGNLGYSYLIDKCFFVEPKK